MGGCYFLLGTFFFLHFKHFHRKLKTKCSIKTKTKIKHSLLRRALPRSHPYVILIAPVFSSLAFITTVQRYTFHSFAALLSLSLAIRPRGQHRICRVDYYPSNPQAYASYTVQVSFHQVFLLIGTLEIPLCTKMTCKNVYSRFSV